jgi:hypothetical protein
MFYKKKMTSLDTLNEELLLTRRPRAPILLGGCVGVVLAVQFFLICALVAAVGLLTPELKTVLKDVGTMLPQMHKSMELLGTMLPDIQDGLKVLDKLCAAEASC